MQIISIFAMYKYRVERAERHQYFEAVDLDDLVLPVSRVKAAEPSLICLNGAWAPS